jgi:hypothetical protein
MIFPLASASRMAVGQPGLTSNGCQWYFPGDKVRPGHDADNSPPSNGEVKNE